MYCILKDSRTFKAITGTACSVTDYDLTLESIYDEVSEITVVGAKTKPKEQDFVYLENGFQGIVTEVQPEGDAWQLRCRQMVTLFDRDMFYVEPTGATLESRLKNMIDANYTNQPDEVYRLPFLQVIAETSTSGNVNPDIEDGLYNVKSYISKLRRLHNIFVTFEMKKTALIVRIARRAVPVKNLDFSDADYNIIERSFSQESIGRITTKAEDTGAIRHWYLLENGTITNTYSPTGRTKGEWRSINIGEAAGAADAVKDEFMKNTYSHSIQFTATPQKARFSFYDGLKIAMDGRLFSSYIAAVKIKKGSRLTEYQCGELRTTYPLKNLI